MKGAFLLTFDVELLWGVFFDEGWRRRGERRWTGIREVFREILELLARHEVRATFAFVGHLCLTRCRKVGGRAHPEMPRPRNPVRSGDWYDLDPGTDLESDPLWYAPDLVETVRAEPLGHEIGCHGFSHAFLDDGRELARAEIRASARAMERFGIRPRSFVYPRNLVAYTDELAPAGFTCFRERYRGGSRALGLLRKAAGARPPVGRAVRAGDVIQVPAGVPLLPAMGLRRLVGGRARRREVVSGLERAAAEGAILHLWTHPHNFAEGRGRMLCFLEEALREVSRFRERGKIEVQTMSEVRP